MFIILGTALQIFFLLFSLFKKSLSFIDVVSWKVLLEKLFGNLFCFALLLVYGTEYLYCVIYRI